MSRRTKQKANGIRKEKLRAEIERRKAEEVAGREVSVERGAV